MSEAGKLITVNAEGQAVMQWQYGEYVSTQKWPLPGVQDDLASIVGTNWAATATDAGYIPHPETTVASAVSMWRNRDDGITDYTVAVPGQDPDTYMYQLTGDVDIPTVQS